MQNFQGKVALVTGGGSGIGKALALALAREGMKVGVADIKRETAKLVADEIKSTGGTATALQMDVSDRASVSAAIDELRRSFGPVLLLCANAGIGGYKSFADLTAQDWDWHVGVNVLGVTNCVSAVLPDMIAARDGHIVNTGSVVGLLGDWMPMMGAYAASKAAVIGMSVAMQPELKQYGIGVSVLCPARVATNIRESQSYRPERFGPAENAAFAMSSAVSEKYKEKYDRSIVRTPDEVAAMTLRAIHDNTLFIATDAATREEFAQHTKRITDAFDVVEDFDKTARRS